MFVCPKIDQRIYDKVKNLYDENHYETQDDFNDAIIDNFYDEMFSESNPDYENLVDNFKMIMNINKFIKKEQEERNTLVMFRFNEWDNFEMVIDCYSYYVAEKIMINLSNELNLPKKKNKKNLHKTKEDKFFEELIKMV